MEDFDQNVARPLSSDRSGVLVQVAAGREGYYAFRPRPLPPDPPLLVDAELQGLLDRANQAIGRLDGITLLLPDPDQFLYTFIRKEAVLSSQIEGTQSSLSDLLLFENDAAPGIPREDAEETANYIAAMDYGLTPGVPQMVGTRLRGKVRLSRTFRRLGPFGACVYSRRVPGAPARLV
jgi:Fic/DOC family N-terminal